MSAEPTAPSARSLADDLRGRGDAALLALLRARPDLASPVPADITQLATRAGTRASVGRALDRLDRWTLQVLEVVAALPEPATYAEVAPLLTSPEADVRRALDRLTEQALLWGADEGIRLVRAARDLIGANPAGLGPPLEAALAAASPRRVQDLLDDLGLPATADPVSGAAAVAAHLTVPGVLDDLLAGAPAQAVEALGQLTWGPAGGSLDNADRPVRAATAGTPVEWLLARGLLVAAGRDSVVLPREVALHLRGHRVHRVEEPEPPPAVITPHDAVLADRTAAAVAFDAVRRVEDLLEAWGVDPPAVLRAGGLGVRDLRRTAALVDLPEPDAALLIESAYAAGLLGPSGEVDEVWLPTPAYDGWRRGPVAVRWATVAGAWLETTRVPALVGGRDERDRGINALSADLDRGVAADVRAAVLHELAALPPGSTATAESLAGRLRWARPRRGGRLRDDLVTWTLHEAERLGVTGRGALSRAGRALLADDPAAAAAALEPLLPQPLDHVLLQADLTAVAPGPLEIQLAHELALMADVESTGGATVYRFTEASVRRALDAGRTAGELAELLERHSRTPVPQPLTYLVEDVGRRHGRIRVGVASAYVRCDDEALLAEVTADRRSASLRLRRLAPGVLAAQAPVDALLARLREMGYAPVPESPDGDVVLHRPDARRTPPRQRPPRLVVDPPPPHDDLLAATVRAVRAGDRAATVQRRPLVLAPARPDTLPRTATAQTLTALQDAAAGGRLLWIGYVDNEGTTSERVVEPIRVERGYLTAYDHRRDAVHTFAVHRITGVAELPATE